MSRKRIEKTAFKLGSDDRLTLAPTRAIIVYERESDGTVGDAAVGYTTEFGGTLVEYPLLADSNGKFQAWYAGGRYFIYTLADEDYEPWEAVSATDLGGRVLGQAIKTDANAQSTVTGTPGTDVAGLSVTIEDMDGGPVMVEAFTPSISNSSTGGAIMGLFEDGVLIGYAQSAVGANQGISVRPSVPRTPTPGDHTYKAAIWRIAAAGTTTLIAAATGPSWIRVVEA